MMSRFWAPASLLLFLLPAVTLAQLNVSGSEPLSLSVSPTYPQPGGQVTITPASPAVTFANSTMRLLVNGKEVYAGAVRPTDIQLAPVGQTTSIRAIVTGEGQTLSKTISLAPGGVSLVLEPLASAPPLYGGKALAPESGTVRLVAVADFRTSPSARIDPSLLSYTWTVDDVTLVNSSGIGKSSIEVSSPLLYRNRKVSVVVQNRSETLVGGDSLSFTSHSPTVRIYRDDPLMGIQFDRAVTGTEALTGTEMTLLAEPYSFSLRKGAPTTNWLLSGTPAQTGGEITLRPQGTGEGSAQVSAQVTNSATNETALADVTLTFGHSGGTFFGL